MRFTDVGVLGGTLEAQRTAADEVSLTVYLNAPTAMDFDRACVNCHTSNVADSDYVFTVPGELP